MLFKLLLISFMFNPTAFAEKLTSTIYSIDQRASHEPYLIRFDNGRASFVSSEKSKVLSVLYNGMTQGHSLSVIINKDNQVISAQALKRSLIASTNEGWDNEKNPYDPSVLKSSEEALKVFRKMRRDYNLAGECFNRAHIWSYEEFKRTGFKSMKIFMFFTESYIRKYKYHWWFHVTPASYVGDTKTLKTLDRRYTSAPRKTKTWSDAFIKSKRACKVVKKFDDYWLNQQREDCYHIYSSMYYVIPRDLEKRDITGMEKSEFVEKEIIRAYKNGFGKVILP